MKKEALSHPKTYDLASRLNCSRPEAIGYLNLLWDFTEDHAIRGDVGKWHNGAIARACEWRGDPDEFVSALIYSGWIDEHQEHRLIIHDWPDHAMRWVKAKLSKAKQTFLDCYRRDRADCSGDCSGDFKPNQTKPNPPPTPSKRSDNGSDNRDEQQGGEGDWTELAALFAGKTAKPRTVAKKLRACGLSEKQACRVVQKFLREHPDAKGGALATYVLNELTPELCQAILKQPERPP